MTCRNAPLPMEIFTVLLPILTGNSFPRCNDFHLAKIEPFKAYKAIMLCLCAGSCDVRQIKKAATRLTNSMNTRSSSRVLRVLTLCALTAFISPKAQVPPSANSSVEETKALVDSYVWKEVGSKELVIDALDVQEGRLFFQYKGKHLYFSPKSSDATTRSIALVAIMSELRLAKSVVISYSTLAKMPAQRHFPFYIPKSLVATGADYSPVGSFYFKY
jgi:hypothetical protein